MEIQANRAPTIQDNRKLNDKEKSHSLASFADLMVEDREEKPFRLKSPLDVIAEMEEAEEDEKAPLMAAPHTSPTPFCAIYSPTSEKGVAPIAPSPQVAEIFDHIATRLTFIDEKGIQETTIELTDPHYAKSPFYGATITIREYSTAPKTFNVYLTASSVAVSLFQTHASALIEAFPYGKGKFSIHRYETHLAKTLIKPIESEEEQNSGDDSR